jgi:hypothetical protein
VKQKAIWHVPLLIAAGITALAGVAASFAVVRGAVPGPWAPALPWALGGASLTFTLARIVHARRVGQRELELIVLASAILVAGFFLFAAAGAIVLSLLGLIGTETRARHDERRETAAPTSDDEE